MDDERKRIVKELGASVVRAFREKRSAVTFVRCDDPLIAADATRTLTAVGSTVAWAPLELVGEPDPVEALSAAGSGPRPTIVLVTAIDEPAIDALSHQRDAYDRATVRGVFLVSSRQARAFGRRCPAFWDTRDAYVAWPDVPHAARKAAEVDPKEIAHDRVAAAEQLASTPERATALFQAARGAFYTGADDDAERGFLKALEPMKAHHMLPQIAETYELLGVLAEKRSDWRGAEGWYDQSLTQWKAMDDARGLGNLLGRIGSLRFRLDDVDGASRYLNQALKQDELVGDSRRLCDSLRRLAMVREREGAVKDASTLFQRALDLVEPLDDTIRIAHCVHHLGRMKERLGLLDDAFALYERSYKYKLLAGDEPGMATSLHQMGNIHFLKAEYDQAVVCYRQALGREHRCGDERGMASTLVQLGLLLEQRFDYEEALRCLLRSVPLLRRLRSGALAEVDAHIKRCRGMIPANVIEFIEDDVSKGAPDAAKQEQQLAEREDSHRSV